MTTPLYHLVSREGHFSAFFSMKMSRFDQDFYFSANVWLQLSTYMHNSRLNLLFCHLAADLRGSFHYKDCKPVRDQGRAYSLRNQCFCDQTSKWVKVWTNFTFWLKVFYANSSSCLYSFDDKVKILAHGTKILKRASLIFH